MNHTPAKHQNILLRMVLILCAYFGLLYYGGEWGRRILYPITLLVTFLHEFGHAVGAIITGGDVLKLQVNQDGSGFTKTSGGSQAIILMGGYLGSAIFGNVLFYIGAKLKTWSKPVVFVLAAAMAISGLVWFNSIFTSLFLFAFAIIFILIAIKTNFSHEVLMLFGLMSIIHIIRDFNVGPTSDLKRYAEIMLFIPASAWMYIWLGIAVILFGVNIRMLFRNT